MNTTRIQENYYYSDCIFCCFLFDLPRQETNLQKTQNDHLQAEKPLNQDHLCLDYVAHFPRSVNMRNELIGLVGNILRDLTNIRNGSDLGWNFIFIYKTFHM